MSVADIVKHPEVQEGVTIGRDPPTVVTKPVGADDIEYDGQSTIHAPEEVVSAEQLQLIKARTMYQMVEEIDGGSSLGKRRIIFLTNAQADLIATQPNSIGIRRLVQALEIPQPKLIINIISSWGFSEFSSVCPPWEGGGSKDWNLGIAHLRSPFVNAEDERIARERIDAFILDIIIPLAAKTNAVVVCEAVKQERSPPFWFMLNYTLNSTLQLILAIFMAGVCVISQSAEMCVTDSFKVECKTALYYPFSHF